MLEYLSSYETWRTEVITCDDEVFFEEKWVANERHYLEYWYRSDNPCWSLDRYCYNCIEVRTVANIPYFLLDDGREYTVDGFYMPLARTQLSLTELIPLYLR